MSIGRTGTTGDHMIGHRTTSAPRRLAPSASLRVRWSHDGLRTQLDPSVRLWARSWPSYPLTAHSEALQPAQPLQSADQRCANQFCRRCRVLPQPQCGSRQNGTAHVRRVGMSSRPPAYRQVEYGARSPQVLCRVPRKRKRVEMTRHSTSAVHPRLARIRRVTRATVQLARPHVSNVLKTAVVLARGLSLLA